MNAKIKKNLITFGKYLSLVLMALIVFVPIISVIFSSFKTKLEYLKSPRIAPPESFLNFENYIRVFTDGKILLGMMNTVIIIMGSLVLGLLFGTMTAYVLKRFQFPGRRIIEAAYLIASFIPSVIVHLIVFTVFSKVGLVDTLAAPVIIYAGVDVVSLYLFMQFINQIPYDLDEAALLEGCSYFGIYKKIILPLLKPAMMTVAILKITSIYNDFYIAFLYLPGEKNSVMSTMLYRFMGPYSSQWNVIAAGILIVILPIFIIFLVAQKHIYKGFVDGAVKA